MISGWSNFLSQFPQALQKFLCETQLTWCCFQIVTVTHTYSSLSHRRRSHDGHFGVDSKVSIRLKGLTHFHSPTKKIERHEAKDSLSQVIFGQVNIKDYSKTVTVSYTCTYPRSSFPH